MVTLNCVTVTEACICSNAVSSAYYVTMYTVFQKNPCDYVFDDNLNSKRPIVIIFGTVIT